MGDGGLFGEDMENFGTEQGGGDGGLQVPVDTSECRSLSGLPGNDDAKIWNRARRVCERRCTLFPLLSRTYYDCCNTGFEAWGGWRGCRLCVYKYPAFYEETRDNMLTVLGRGMED